MVNVKCTSCGHKNDFDQPHPYHAGFANEGFLYNNAGNLTLVWSSFDPAYEAIVGKWHPWALTPEQQAHFEGALPPAPSGGSWRFINPARCARCAKPISDPITQSIYYLLYPGSIVTDLGPADRHLKEYLSLPRA
jgi:hypothetical protein